MVLLVVELLSMWFGSCSTQHSGDVVLPKTLCAPRCWFGICTKACFKPLAEISLAQVQKGRCLKTFYLFDILGKVQLTYDIIVYCTWKMRMYLKWLGNNCCLSLRCEWDPSICFCNSLKLLFSILPNVLVQSIKKLFYCLPNVSLKSVFFQWFLITLSTAWSWFFRTTVT